MTTTPQPGDIARDSNNDLWWRDWANTGWVFCLRTPGNWKHTSDIPLKPMEPLTLLVRDNTSVVEEPIKESAEDVAIRELADAITEADQDSTGLDPRAVAARLVADGWRRGAADPIGAALASERFTTIVVNALDYHVGAATGLPPAVSCGCGAGWNDRYQHHRHLAAVIKAALS